MASRTPSFTILAYCALPHAGNGWTQTCVSILQGLAGPSVRAVLVVPRLRVALPPGVEPVRSMAPPLSVLPWRYAGPAASASLAHRFMRLLDEADPTRTIAYCWPGVPTEVIRHARRRGILTVREMINTFQGGAKRILDRAYERLGLPPTHTISAASVEQERRELMLYDYVCASNGPCEDSLREAGIPPERIVPTSFGWSPERYPAAPAVPAPGGLGPARFLFAGIIGVRKGVPDLLAAWAKAGVKGELTLVGHVEPGIEPLLSQATAGGSVKVLPFTRDIAALYRSHDVFVFPTLEEGGPQVTIEAGGCGLPVITTPMGAARLVRDGVNGIVVPAADPASLAAAIAKLAADAALRREYADRIGLDAQNFTYRRVGAERARLFLDRLRQRHGLGVGADA
jgi:glycosyltransferase involved in cell wall biosynthesis